MQIIIITGGNSGLGFATAGHLLQKGYGVIIACRNLAGAEAAKKLLKTKTGFPNVRVKPLDLACMQSIRAFVNELSDEPYGLICNAGLQYAIPTKYTADGIELTFGVNVLGHFLLTNLLLAKFKNLQRIAVVSSAVHDPRISGTRFGQPAFTEPELMAHPKDAANTDWSKTGNTRYVTSKLCNLLFAYKLNELLSLNGRNGVLVNAFNPGLMAGTGLGRNSTPMTRFVWYYILPIIAKTFKGSSTPGKSGLLLADLLTGFNESGKYFSLDKETLSSPESYDREKMDILWKGCEALTGLTPAEKWYR